MKKSYEIDFSFSTFLGLLCVSVFMHSSCLNTIDYSEDPTSLEFSVDTLKFDTVFTSRGTATRSFKAFNPTENAVRTDVSLAEMTPFFNMNVDGIAGDEVKDVEILPGDSIYIFAEATIDPMNPLSVSPFIIEDKINFNTNGKMQSVRMEAYGQDANYLTADSLQGQQVYLSCDMGEVTFEDQRPFILNGILVVDSCTLNLAAGTELYVHGGVRQNNETTYTDGAIIIRKHGKLQVSGTIENPVTINGDRIEDEFNNVSGQWSGIRFIEGSEGNMLKHCNIKNANIGVYVDSLSELKIIKSKITNSSFSNILASTGNIEASNSLFANAGEFSVNLSSGGNYDFIYTTIANYGSGSPALYCANQFQPRVGEAFQYIPIDFNIRNSIISSSNNDALAISMYNREFKEVNLEFHNTGIRSTDLTDAENGYPEFYDHFSSSFRIEQSDNLFVNPIEFAFTLDTLSVAEEKAMPLQDYPRDILEEMRDNEMPDIGCYEYIY